MIFCGLWRLRSVFYTVTVCHPTIERIDLFISNDNGIPTQYFPAKRRTSLVILLYHIADYSNLPHYIVQIVSLLRKYYFQRPTYYHLREIALIISNLSQSPQRLLCLWNMLGHISLIRINKNLILLKIRKNITKPTTSSVMWLSSLTSSHNAVTPIVF